MYGMVDYQTGTTQPKEPEMERLSCSTSLCPLPRSTEGILSHLESRCRHLITSLLIDPRLMPEEQLDLMQLSKLRGYRFTDLCHPRFSRQGLKTASAVSRDREERRQAQMQIIESIDRAHRFEVRRVIFLPWRLKLSVTPAGISESYARNVPLNWLQFEAERHEQLQGALDSLCFVFEEALRRADDLGVALRFATPTLWPHQVPGREEVHKLMDEFGGAPVGELYRTDWAYVRSQLNEEEWHIEGAVCEAVMLADACGLKFGLPLGLGEISWRTVLGKLPKEISIIFNFGADTSPQEVAQSYGAIEDMMRSTEGL